MPRSMATQGVISIHGPRAGSLLQTSQASLAAQTHTQESVAWANTALVLGDWISRRSHGWQLLYFLGSKESSARRLNQSVLKETNSEYSLHELTLKLKFQYFGHLMRRSDSLEKTLMLGKI